MISIMIIVIVVIVVIDSGAITRMDKGTSKRSLMGRGMDPPVVTRKVLSDGDSRLARS